MMEHAARAWWWAGSGLLAALACCVPAVSAGSSAKMMASEGQQHLQQSWAKLDAEARNHATNVYTVAHAFLEMGATPEQHNLVVHSLGAATATEGQSQDPNAM
jgi:uncharacterized OsmC-like protein